MLLLHGGKWSCQVKEEGERQSYLVAVHKNKWQSRPGPLSVHMAMKYAFLSACTVSRHVLLG